MKHTCAIDSRRCASVARLTGTSIVATDVCAVRVGSTYQGFLALIYICNFTSMAGIRNPSSILPPFGHNLKFISTRG